MFLGLLLQVVNDTSAVTINKNSHLFLQIDPWGIGMTIIGYVVVFVALLLLYLIFYNLSRVLQINVKNLLRKEGKPVNEADDITITGEVNAAIAMAIYLYNEEIHDKESAVLTINKISRTYSPWSSKIYGLRQHPRS